MGSLSSDELEGIDLDSVRQVFASLRLDPSKKTNVHKVIRQLGSELRSQAKDNRGGLLRQSSETKAERRARKGALKKELKSLVKEVKAWKKVEKKKRKAEKRHRRSEGRGRDASGDRNGERREPYRNDGPSFSGVDRLNNQAPNANFGFSNGNDTQARRIGSTRLPSRNENGSQIQGVIDDNKEAQLAAAASTSGPRNNPKVQGTGFVAKSTQQETYGRSKNVPQPASHLKNGTEQLQCDHPRHNMETDRPTFMNPEHHTTNTHPSATQAIDRAKQADRAREQAGIAQQRARMQAERARHQAGIAQQSTRAQPAMPYGPASGFIPQPWVPPPATPGPNGFADSFERGMEDWGRSLQAWGERFGRDVGLAGSRVEARFG